MVLVLWLLWSLIVVLFCVWGCYCCKQGWVCLIDGLQVYEYGQWQCVEKLLDGVVRDLEVSVVVLVIVVCSVQVWVDGFVGEVLLQCLGESDVILQVLLCVEQLLVCDLLVDVINVLDVVVIQLLLLCGLWLCMEVLVQVGCVYEVYGQLGVLCQSKVLLVDVNSELEV